MEGASASLLFFFAFFALFRGYFQFVFPLRLCVRFFPNLGRVIAGRPDY
jgi:hypothetical protein